MERAIPSKLTTGSHTDKQMHLLMAINAKLCLPYIEDMMAYLTSCYFMHSHLLLPPASTTQIYNTHPYFCHGFAINWFAGVIWKFHPLVSSTLVDNNNWYINPWVNILLHIISFPSYPPPTRIIRNINIIQYVSNVYVLNTHMLYYE